MMRALTLGSALLLLEACAGRSSAPALLPPETASHETGASATTASASITFVLPAIQPAGMVIDWSKNPEFLSPATALLRGTVGTKKIGPVALNATNPNCSANVSSGLVCTIV